MRKLRLRKKRREKMNVQPIAITSLLFFVQLIILFEVYTRLDKYQGVFNISWHLISIILALFIINKEENSAYKIAWILPMCVFPLVGIILYVLIKVLPGTKQLSDVLKTKICMSSQYIHQNEDVLKSFKEVDSNYASMAKFLYEYESFPLYADTKLEYYSLGEYAFESIKKELLKARDYIFIEFFIVSRGYMLTEVLDILEKKANEGVEIRFMYDGANMFSLPDNYSEFISSKGIDCKIFSPVKPIISSYQNNRDHRKIIVIDGKIGFTGGINIADEYINKKERFGHWKDCAIRIEGHAVKSLAAMFLQMWNVNEKDKYEMEDYNTYLLTEKQKRLKITHKKLVDVNGLLHEKKRYQLKEKLKNNPKQKVKIRENLLTFKCKNCVIQPMRVYANYAIPYGDYPSNMNNTAEAIYIHILFYAKKYVDIMTPYLIIDDELINAMSMACKRGIRVRLLLPGIPDKKIPYMVAQSYFTALMDAGVQIYIYTKGFVHSKVFVSDDIVSTVGTVNLDYRSLYLHFENGIFCYDRELALDIEEDFENTLKTAKLMTHQEYRNISVFNRLLGRLFRVFAPLM